MLLIFWPLLRSGCSMDYHGNHYFSDVKISDFVAGNPEVSYIIELNHMLHYNFRQIMHILYILNKWVGYFEPSL